VVIGVAETAVGFGVAAMAEAIFFVLFLLDEFLLEGKRW